MKPDVGLLGELLVEQRLVELGWYPVRLNGRSSAINSDLIAIRADRRVSIQVKATHGGSAHSHSQHIHLGNAGPYLQKQVPFFNSKVGPIEADVVVGVNYSPAGSRFVVLPVALAESLCRFHADYWTNVASRSGQRRADAFPIYLSLTAKPRTHQQHHARIMLNVTACEDRWSILDEPIAVLHDIHRWPLL